MPAATCGAITRHQVAKTVAGVDAIEIKATIPDTQIEPALNRYGLTIDNEEKRQIFAEVGAEQDLEQQTRTRWALQYHADRLRDRAAADLQPAAPKQTSGAIRFRRNEQQLQASLHKQLTVNAAAGRISVTLDIVVDGDDPYAPLAAYAADGEQLAEVRVAPGFRLTNASANAWIDDDFRRPG